MSSDTTQKIKIMADEVQAQVASVPPAVEKLVKASQAASTSAQRLRSTARKLRKSSSSQIQAVKAAPDK